MRTFLRPSGRVTIRTPGNATESDSVLPSPKGWLRIMAGPSSSKGRANGGTEVVMSLPQEVGGRRRRPNLSLHVSTAFRTRSSEELHSSNVSATSRAASAARARAAGEAISSIVSAPPGIVDGQVAAVDRHSLPRWRQAPSGVGERGSNTLRISDGKSARCASLEPTRRDRCSSKVFRRRWCGTGSDVRAHSTRSRWHRHEVNRQRRRFRGHIEVRSSGRSRL